MSDPILQDCVGCSMKGKYGIQATKTIEQEIRVDDPCPNTYEDSLKGISCLVLHFHFEKKTRYLCDKHYEIHEKYKNQDSITLR